MLLLLVRLVLVIILAVAAVAITKATLVDSLVMILKLLIKTPTILAARHTMIMTAMVLLVIIMIIIMTTAPRTRPHLLQRNAVSHLTALMT